jgi:hypothetical protein
MTRSQSRLDADLARGIPVQMQLGPNGSQTFVPDMVLIAQRRCETMPFAEVIATMRDDYGVTMSVDASGRWSLETVTE